MSLLLLAIAFVPAILSKASGKILSVLMIGRLASFFSFFFGPKINGLVKL